MKTVETMNEAQPTGSLSNRRRTMNYILSVSLPFALLLSAGCKGRQATPQALPNPNSSQLQQLWFACPAYHREHHTQDEQAVGVLGNIEFTDYQVLGIEPRAGSALVTLGVSQKSVAHAGFYSIRSVPPIRTVVPPAVTREGVSSITIAPASTPNTSGEGFRIEEIWVYRGGQWTFDKRVETPFMVGRD